MLGLFIVLILVVVVWWFYVYYLEFVLIVKIIELEKSEICFFLLEVSEFIDQVVQEDEVIFQDELDDKIVGEVGVYEYVVFIGDMLSSILNQYGIDMSDIS